jgi:hypothetical protein
LISCKADLPSGEGGRGRRRREGRGEVRRGRKEEEREGGGEEGGER